MQQLVISLPDSTCQQLTETVKALNMPNYSPEKWVTEYLICEMAARRSHVDMLNRDAVRRLPRMQKAKV